ncbi:CapA family protein [Glutamicibacter sp. NPDC087344]|uniref:CapA family protein n=1 Tax=Glutamicibacter sp. NPDC087344 TaxID=3363994 RepID=UPI0038141A6E
MTRRRTVLAVGDLVLDENEVAKYFEPTRDLFAAADISICQIEVPHTSSTEVTSTDVPAPPAPEHNVEQIGLAGFNIATLAGNHIYDCGLQGITDTRRLAQDAGLAVTGAGINLEQAKEPAIVDMDGVSLGVANYNCVGPKDSWATSKKAGCAHVNVLTHYELDSANPGGPPSIYTFAEPKALKSFIQDVKDLAARVDFPIVALHKGIGHMPAEVADYEIQLAHAAIDAGAKAVISHHAHIMRGIEVYRGAPIYHGLGNFVTVTNALNTTGQDSPERIAWAKRRRKLFGFDPDPTMPNYAFHPQSRNTGIARLEITEQGELGAGFIPCWIGQDAVPRPLRNEADARPVVEYLQHITAEAGFDTTTHWVEDYLAIDLTVSEEQPS